MQSAQIALPCGSEAIRDDPRTTTHHITRTAQAMGVTDVRIETGAMTGMIEDIGRGQETEEEIGLVRKTAQIEFAIGAPHQKETGGDIKMEEETK